MNVGKTVSTTPTADVQEWVQELSDAIGRAAREVVLGDPRIDSPLAREEGLRYLMRCVSLAALQAVENDDPAYPHFNSFLTPFIQWALPNPDYTYDAAPVHGDRQYRVFGRLGTAHFFLVETYGGALDRIDEWRVIDAKADRDLQIGADGEIEIGFGREPVEGIENWVQIPEGHGWIFVRNAYYDWENELPARLEIERLGASYPPPPTTPEQLRERLDSVVRFIRDGTPIVAKSVSRFYDVPEDTIAFPPFPLGEREHQNQVGLRGQYYGNGHYRCAPEEAIILEVPEPRCRYWMFGLVSQYMEALDWYDHQTLINGHQALIDEDGRFRAVIAHHDPAVPNWLDTCGRERGLLTARYTWPEDPENLPVHTLRTVPLADVRKHLPPSTPTVTPEQRSDYLRRRMLSVRRRYTGF